MTARSIRRFTPRLPLKPYRHFDKTRFEAHGGRLRSRQVIPVRPGGTQEVPSSYRTVTFRRNRRRHPNSKRRSFKFVLCWELTFARSRGFRINERNRCRIFPYRLKLLGLCGFDQSRNLGNLSSLAPAGTRRPSKYELASRGHPASWTQFATLATRCCSPQGPWRVLQWPARPGSAVPVQFLT